LEPRNRHHYKVEPFLESKQQKEGMHIGLQVIIHNFVTRWQKNMDGGSKNILQQKVEVGGAYLMESKQALAEEMINAIERI
jgi:hypothetical protein